MQEKLEYRPEEVWTPLSGRPTWEGTIAGIEHRVRLTSPNRPFTFARDLINSFVDPEDYVDNTHPFLTSTPVVFGDIPTLSSEIHLKFPSEESRTQNTIAGMLSIVRKNGAKFILIDAEAIGNSLYNTLSKLNEFCPLLYKRVFTNYINDTYFHEQVHLTEQYLKQKEYEIDEHTLQQQQHEQALKHLLRSSYTPAVVSAVSAIGVIGTLVYKHVTNVDMDSLQYVLLGSLAASTMSLASISTQMQQLQRGYNPQEIRAIVAAEEALEEYQDPESPLHHAQLPITVEFFDEKKE